jgi:hypothetical protein
MPVGLYTRKGANGRRMYFRDGKLISKKSYDMSRSRRSTRKGQRRKTARRAYTGTRSRRRNMARRKPAMPHPSITGMAAGLSVANYLNQGTSVGIGTLKTGGVIKDTLDGNLNSAFSSLSKNAVDLATSSGGKAVLSSAIVLATAGGLARKWFPSVKLGGTKLYFKI